jgi:hypothetical protein
MKVTTMMMMMMMLAQSFTIVGSEGEKNLNFS